MGEKWVQKQCLSCFRAHALELGVAEAEAVATYLAQQRHRRLHVELFAVERDAGLEHEQELGKSFLVGLCNILAVVGKPGESGAVDRAGSPRPEDVNRARIGRSIGLQAPISHSHSTVTAQSQHSHRGRSAASDCKHQSACDRDTRARRKYVGRKGTGECG